MTDTTCRYVHVGIEFTSPGKYKFLMQLLPGRARDRHMPNLRSRPVAGAADSRALMQFHVHVSADGLWRVWPVDQWGGTQVGP
ncbi:hypothetical protein E2C01_031437 [Portunus trituberculatus]|uniref:Uncharacterized protein n=1 Tax=Portunus trituberculatus TaxID=210409 RepID=A0A5B7EUI7_PORTR|nr:hypothetical protein [Portunus trituberculatus]